MVLIVGRQNSVMAPKCAPGGEVQGEARERYQDQAAAHRASHAAPTSQPASTSLNQCTPR